MFINKLSESFVGSVAFEVRGSGVEHFLNCCMKNDIYISNIEFFDDYARMQCSVSNYKKIQKLKTKNIKRKIIKKKGIRFYLFKQRKRIGLTLGAILMISMLIFLSGFVWKIDVVGNTKVSSDVILETLGEGGFVEGIRKEKLDFHAIKNHVLRKLPDVSSILISLDGCCAKVEITERELPPIREDKSKPSNLIAKCDGQIVKMEIVKGKPIATVGSGVVKGELLVSGLYNDKKDNIIIEHSSGKVFALTEHSKVFEVSYQKEEVCSVVEKIYYSISFFDSKNEIVFGKNLDKKGWEIKKNTKKVSLFGLILPIFITENRCTKQEYMSVTLKQNEAKELIKMEIEHFEKEEFFECDIKEKNVFWKTDDNKSLKAIVEYVVVGNIAVQQYIETDG